MSWKGLLRRALPAAVGLAAVLAMTPLPAAESETVCRANSDYCVEVDGTYAPDARCFTTKNDGRMLVDIPSLSTSLLLNVKTKKVFSIPPSSLKREDGESLVRLVDPVPPDAPAYDLSIEGEVLRFKVDRSEVRVQKASSCQAAVVPGWTTGPVTDDSSARKCVHLEQKPITATAGCTKVAFLRNSCASPVMAVVHSVQHLQSGTLPEDSSVVIAPNGEYPLGCTWSSGAMAPTTFEVRAAQFLPKRPR